jgi:DNA-binding NtrC family response regulator
MDNHTIDSRPKVSGPTGLEILAGLKLVLVDDEPGVLRALTMVLEALKCEVSPFNTPTAALAYLISKPPVDLILSDMRMPELSGTQLLKNLRQSEVTAPFILMSGHANIEDVDEARSLGLDGFISKPFTPTQLAEIVGRVVGRGLRQPGL